MENDNLSLYRRHDATCEFRHLGRRHIRCSCPVWVDGQRDGKRPRRSLKTRSWDVAEQRLAKLAAGYTIPALATSPTLKHAVEAYIAHSKFHKKAQSTIRNRQGRLATLVDHFPEGTQIKFLTPTNLEAWRVKRASVAPGSVEGDFGILRGFMTFVMKKKWLSENPTEDLENIKADAQPTLPYTIEETEKLLAACAKMQPRLTGPKAALDRIKAEAVLRVMLDAGLRISDTAKLARREVDLVTGDVVLPMLKTGDGLVTGLSEPTLRLLRQIPTQGEYFFWSGVTRDTKKGYSGLPSAISRIDKTIRAVGKIAGVAEVRAHRFRDSFAVRLLEAGESIDDLSILLGHRDIRTTKKHYWHFSPKRKQQVRSALTRMHDSVAAQFGADAQHDRVGNAQGNLRAFPASRKKAG